MTHRCETLKDLPDLDLVKNIKENNTLAGDSALILADRHSGLYVSTIMKTSGTSIPNLRDDLLEEKLFVLYTAANTYDEKRGTLFSTHFANKARWNCLKNKSKKCNIELTCESSFIDAVLHDRGDFDQINIDESEEIVQSIHEEIEKISDPKARKIMEMRYFSASEKNIPWKKIAKSVKLSIQGCIDVHNRYIEQIRKNIRRKYR